MKTRRFPEDARTKSAGRDQRPLSSLQEGSWGSPGKSSSQPGPVEQRKSGEGGKPHSPESLPHPNSCSGHGETPNTESRDMRLLRCCPFLCPFPGTGATELPKLTHCTHLGLHSAPWLHLWTGLCKKTQTP